MPKYESQIQAAIAEAVEFFFMDPRFGFEVSRENIRIIAPPPGGQAKEVEDFGRKPYDLGFFAAETIALFFEIKERHKSGRISEFKPNQCNMLNILANNGVDIRYAYNAWDFTWGQRLRPDEVLKQAHVREARDMQDEVKIDPVPPALILEDHLRNAASQGDQTLVDILDRDITQIDNFNSMPLMILANLQSNNTKILIDRAPRGALRIMKDLFKLPDNERQSTLMRYALKANGKEIVQMAEAIFEMKDSWRNSKIVKHKP